MLTVLATPEAASAAPPSNDNFADRRVIEALPFTDSQNNTDATTESAEPQPGSPCAGQVTRTVWYEITVPTSQTLVADTIGSDFDTRVSVWTEEEPGDLRLVNCLDEAPGTGAAVVYFGAEANRTYFIQAAADEWSAGNLDFRLERSPYTSISGTVTSDAGGGLEQICVTLRSTADPDGLGWQVRTLSSGSWIQLIGSQGGSFLLDFRDCDGAIDHEEEWYDDKPTKEEADVLVVPPGTPTSSAVFLDTQLHKMPAAPLEIDIVGEGGGTVTSEPAGIDCGSDCEESYPFDTAVVLTAHPDSGSYLAAWGECDAIVGDNQCLLEMRGARSSRAHFHTLPGPVVTFPSGPDFFSNSRDATIEFSSDTPDAVYECRLDDAEMSPCSSPVTLEGLSEGDHSFYVKATSPEGRVGWNGWLWRVDVTPPDTTIAYGPPEVSDASSAEFYFWSTTPPVSPDEINFECSLDGGAFDWCRSPQEYSGLSDGDHTFRVRASDRSGNIDPTPEEHSWSIDTSAPDTTITSGPSGITTDSRATFSFTSDEEDSTFACSLNGSTFAGCESPYTTTLAQGSHTFAVRAIDELGHGDPTPAVRNWVVDTQGPEMTFARPTTGLYLNDQSVVGVGPIVAIGSVTVLVPAKDPESGITAFTFSVNGTLVDPSQVKLEDGTYSFVFRPALPGSYTISALATNGSGLSTSISTQVVGAPAP